MKLRGCTTNILLLMSLLHHHWVVTSIAAFSATCSHNAKKTASITTSSTTLKDIEVGVTVGVGTPQLYIHVPSCQSPEQQQQRPPQPLLHPPQPLLQPFSTTRKGHPKAALFPSFAASPRGVVAAIGIVVGTTITATTTAMSAAWATVDTVTSEVVLAELPPPYVPVLFGLGLLAGVGLLTSSLGNVMDEEASLGLQSGAQARKEIERSRSSYFKKK